MPQLSDEALLTGLAGALGDLGPMPAGLDAACKAAFTADMRAWTVRQPWSSAIVGVPGGSGGPKDVENRTVRTHRRGLVLIHAGLRYDNTRPAPAVLRRWLSELSDGRCPDSASPAALCSGAIVGAAVITGCHQCDGSCSPWAEPSQWHLKLGWRRAFETPVPATGALGPWRVKGDVRDAVLRQLKAVAA